MKMTTLEDIYYGNICPCNKVTKRGSRMDEIIRLICRNEKCLDTTLDAKQRDTFEKFKECQIELSDLTARQAFTDGFILATRIMVEVMEGMGTTA